MVKTKDLHPRSPYPTKLPLTVNSEVKIFTDKKKLKELITSNSVLQIFN